MQHTLENMSTADHMQIHETVFKDIEMAVPKPKCKDGSVQASTVSFL